MALGFDTETKSAGDILPIVKYDAKGGDFIAVNRTQSDDGQWVKNEQEISLPINLGMDLENIEVGWMAFIGGRPDFVMAKIGEPMPAKPTDEHKQAFRLRVGSKDLGLREFSHSAKTVLRAMDELHSSYLAEKAANPGKFPIVNFEGVETIKMQGKEGELRFKAPNWKIEGWTDRPDMFDAGTAPAPTPEPVAQVASDDNPLF